MSSEAAVRKMRETTIIELQKLRDIFMGDEKLFEKLGYQGDEKRQEMLRNFVKGGPDIEGKEWHSLPCISSAGA